MSFGKKSATRLHWWTWYLVPGGSRENRSIPAWPCPDTPYRRQNSTSARLRTSRKQSLSKSSHESAEKGSSCFRVCDGGSGTPVGGDSSAARIPSVWPRLSKAFPSSEGTVQYYSKSPEPLTEIELEPSCAILNLAGWYKSGTRQYPGGFRSQVCNAIRPIKIAGPSAPSPSTCGKQDP